MVLVRGPVAGGGSGGGGICWRLCGRHRLRSQSSKPIRRLQAGAGQSTSLRAKNSAGSASDAPVKRIRVRRLCFDGAGDGKCGAPALARRQEALPPTKRQHASRTQQQPPLVGSCAVYRLAVR